MYAFNILSPLLLREALKQKAKQKWSLYLGILASPERCSSPTANKQNNPPILLLPKENNQPII